MDRKRNNAESRQDRGQALSPSPFAAKGLGSKAIELFPYPIQVYDPDGTSVLVNEALLAEYHAFSPDLIVGKYNVLKDPSVIASIRVLSLPDSGIFPRRDS